MKKHKLNLDLLPERFAIARFDPEADLPEWARASAFVSVTRTRQELSIVCPESLLPPSLEAERGLRCLGVQGPLQFSEIGILASLTGVLAETEISVFSISTYDTDYLLLADKDLDRAVRALTDAGHVIATD